MNSPGTPILHETSSDRASGYRILIYLGGLEAFVAISCSCYAQISTTSQQLLSGSPLLARIFELAYCSLGASGQVI